MKTICRSNHCIGGLEYYLYTQTLKTERIPISDIEIREINYFECIVLSMCGYDDDLSAFLDGFGFTEEELCAVIDELNSYRSIQAPPLGGI
jgi:hypothetical protein